MKRLFATCCALLLGSAAALAQISQDPAAEWLEKQTFSVLEVLDAKVGQQDWTEQLREQRQRFLFYHSPDGGVHLANACGNCPEARNAHGPLQHTGTRLEVQGTDSCEVNTFRWEYANTFNKQSGTAEISLRRHRTEGWYELLVTPEQGPRLEYSVLPQDPMSLRSLGAEGQVPAHPDPQALALAAHHNQTLEAPLAVTDVLRDGIHMSNKVGLHGDNLLLRLSPEGQLLLLRQHADPSRPAEGGRLLHLGKRHYASSSVHDPYTLHTYLWECTQDGKTQTQLLQLLAIEEEEEALYVFQLWEQGLQLTVKGHLEGPLAQLLRR